MRKTLLLLFGYIFLSADTQVWACDLCAIYNSISSQKLEAGKFRFSLSEQYTDFNTVQADSHKIENEQHQYLRSSITQIGAGYDISDKFGLEFSLPVIRRSFRRIEAEEIVKESVSGVGDATILLRYIPISYSNSRSTLFFQLFGGLKLPTGESDRLGEETEEGHSEELPSGHSISLKDGEAEHSSAVHGHDLALGSGSWDVPLGVSVFAEYKRLFLTSNLQYTIRNQGDFQYRYSNDIQWNIGPGAYVALGRKYTIALKANLRGEYKGKDVLNGVKADDTALRAIYLGPELVASYLDCLSADLALDLPLDINNSQTQIVADYRIRAGVTWRF